MRGPRYSNIADVGPLGKCPSPQKSPKSQTQNLLGTGHLPCGHKVWLMEERVEERELHLCLKTCPSAGLDFQLQLRNLLILRTCGFTSPSDWWCGLVVWWLRRPFSSYINGGFKSSIISFQGLLGTGFCPSPVAPVEGYLEDQFPLEGTSL